MDDIITDDPIALFRDWLAEAEQSEPNDANAMALATVDADGTPSVRMVLLKDVDPRGFVFYTNLESRKGQALLATRKAALLFHWKSLRRQVRVEGPVEPVSEAEADAYFASRARTSRLGAWASAQSRPLESRATLVKRVAELEVKYLGGTIPRPPFWSGFRVPVERIEFWRDGAFRLHDRFLYQPEGTGWSHQRLYP